MEYSPADEISLKFEKTQQIMAFSTGFLLSLEAQRKAVVDSGSTVHYKGPRVSTFTAIFRVFHLVWSQDNSHNTSHLSKFKTKEQEQY